MGKDCSTCPAFLDIGAAQTVMGKSIGAPVCARFGHVLGRSALPGSANTKIRESFAERCEAYGEPMPGFATKPQLNPDGLAVSLPAIDALSNTQQVDPIKVNSCGHCEFFVQDRSVTKEWGWPTGACAKKGRLILPSDRVVMARDCEVKSFGTVRDTVGSMRLFERYENNFGALDPVAEYMKAKAAFVEPFDYESDKALEWEDGLKGVRAWRRIKDLEGSGNEVYLPIFRTDFFDDDWKLKIPVTGSDEHPEDYVDHGNFLYRIAVCWTELDETPVLWGMAGVGKTEIFRHLAWLMNMPFERMSITEATELDDLAGKMHFAKEVGTHFKYGRLPVAWSRPCVLCLDEPNTGRPEVWQFIRPLTDNSKQLVLDMNEGERISRNLDAYLGMAMNPAWDARNVGAAPIADADGSRLMHISMGLPPEPLEREIITKRCLHDGWEIPKERLDMVMGIAEDLRKLSDADTLEVTWGVRNQIKAARALRWFTPITAYRMACADFLEPEQADMVLDVVRSHDADTF